MGFLCGWFEPSGAGGEHGALTAMQEALGGCEIGPALIQPPGALGICGDRRTTWQSQIGDYLLALVGHPQWIGHQQPQHIAAVGAVFAQEFRQHGAEALCLLRGDFALALIDTRRSRGLLAVDRFGIRDLVYTKAGSTIIFASTLAALGRHPRVVRSLDPQSIYDYLFFHVVPGPATIYRDQLRVPPGHYVEFDITHITVRQYWAMTYRPIRRPSFASLQCEFIAALRDATLHASHSSRCGTFLSGGTDSSTVTGMLREIGGSPPDTFSIGFDVPGYDEIEYARIAARYFGARHHEYYVTPADVLAAIPKIAGAHDQPFGNASAVPTFYCARMARNLGFERLLAGDGGDELFGGNERYAKHQLFAYYALIPKIARTRVIEPLLVESALLARWPLMQKLRRYVEQARLPMPTRYESTNLLEHLGVDAVLDSAFRRTIDSDHPHALMREALTPYANATLIDQMLGIDLRFVLADGDLPKVTRACALAGIDVTFPMLDAPVVDLAARLPAHYKLRGTRLRWFFKKALRGFLPPAVMAKKKHGFGLPVGVWLTTNRPLFDLASDAIDTLRPHGIVRPSFLDDLRQHLLPAHPAYFGTMMWVLMMLGLWLASERSSPRSGNLQQPQEGGSTLC